jgi:hypothetical protein
MSEWLFNGLWFVGFSLAVSGLSRARDYKMADWEFWAHMLVFGLGASMMVHWIKAIAKGAP